MKKNFNRLIYFGYYLKNLNWGLLNKFMDHTRKSEGISKPKQWWLILTNSLRYNISILEFYQFDFIHKTPEEKRMWAGTGTMYEFQLRVNPLKERSILDDKRLFFKKYNDYVIHDIFTLEELYNDKNLIKTLLSNNEKIVLKEASGKCGSGVSIQPSRKFLKEDLIVYMKKNKFDIVESFINQHSDIQKLSPSAVNTIRIFTKIDDDGNYSILGCRMRISVNSEVDNLAAGNLAAPIDDKTGIIKGPAIYSDITREPVKTHPITGVPIEGFKVPFWKEVLEMVKSASLRHPQNKSIGWDVVITEEGPGLIEGNHDWCKLVWQLPVNEGLKHLLEDQNKRI